MQPHAEVLQGHLRGQARLQPTERMGPFPLEAEGMLELVMDRLHHLADAREPAPQRLGPWPLAVPLGRAEDLGPVDRPPRPLVGLPLKALIDDVRTLCKHPDTSQARMRLTAQSKKRLRPWLLLETGCPAANTGAHASRVHRQQQINAFIPAQTLAPADSDQTEQPTN